MEHPFSTRTPSSVPLFVPVKRSSYHGVFLSSPHMSGFAWACDDDLIYASKLRWIVNTSRNSSMTRELSTLSAHLPF